MGATVQAGDNELNQDNKFQYAQALTAFGFENGYLGVQLSELTSETAGKLGIPERGAHVVDVVSGSPAASAGMQKDDVIVSWNGTPVESAAQLSRQIRETPKGRSVKLGVMRAGRQVNLDVKLGDSPSRARAFSRDRDPSRASMVIRPRLRLGIGLQSLTPQLAEFFGLGSRKGLLVASVVENSGAAKAGIKAGDVVLSVDNQTIERSGDINRTLRDKQEGATVDVKVLRDKQERTFKVQIEKGGESSWWDSDGLFEFDFDDLKVVVPQVHIPHFTMPKVEIPKIEIPRFQIPLIEAYVRRGVIV
jgi:serine protease Do